MASSASYLTNFDNAPKKKEQTWFEKTVKTSVALFATSGLAIAGYKMKGPVSRMLRNHSNDELMRLVNKNISKYENRPSDADYADITKATKSLADEMLEDLNSSNFDFEQSQNLETSPSVLNNIRHKEDTISDAIQSAARRTNDPAIAAAGDPTPIGPQRVAGKNKKIARQTLRDIHRQVSSGAKLSSQIGISDAVRDTLKEQALGRIRQQTILEYIDSGPGMGRADFQQVWEDLSFYDTKGYLDAEDITAGEDLKRISRTTEIHQRLLNEPEYAALYRRRLNPLVRRAQIDPTTLPESTTAKNYKAHLYGNLASPLDGEIDNALVKPHETQLFYMNENTRQDFGMFDKITSGGAKPITSRIKMLDMVGHVEYGQSLKRISSVLENAMTEDSGLASFDMRILSYNYRQEKRYLQLTLNHKTSRSPVVVKIPLETNGYVPASTPSAQSKLGRFYDVESVFLNAKKGKAVRVSNYTLNNLANYLESSAFTSGIGSFRDQPSATTDRILNLVQRVHDGLAPETGADRDLGHILGIVNQEYRDMMIPDKNQSAKVKKNLGAFVKNMSHIKSIARNDKNSVAIMIDLESLSNTKTGIEFQATRSDTQFVKASVVAVDMKTRSTLDGIEIASRHGFDYFNQASVGWSTSLKEWLRNGVVPGGENFSDSEIVSAYRDYLNKINAKGDIANNEQFFKQLKNNIESLRKRFADEGKNVYFVTKNGSLFDLPAMKYNMPGDRWVEETIENNHIDIQATARVLKQGYTENTALSAERMLQNLLRQRGQHELANQVTRGHTMTPATKKKMVKNILNNFVGGTEAPGVGKLSRLLNLSNSLYHKAEKNGWLEGLHASPLLDNLAAFGMFAQQYDHLYDNPMWDMAASDIERVLTSKDPAQSAYNIMKYIEKMSSRTYDGLGVPNVSALSHGMVSKGVLSFIPITMMDAIGGNPLNKQLNQRHGMEYFIRPTSKWIAEHGNVKTTDVIYKKRFGGAVRTDMINDFRTQQLPSATDAANAYSKTVMMKGTYSLDFTKGGDDAGKMLVRDTVLQNFSMTKLDVAVDLGDAIDTQPLLVEKLQRIRSETIKRIQKFEHENGRTASADDWMRISRQVSDGQTIDFSTEILGATKYKEIKVDKKFFAGENLAIIKEEDSRGVARLKLKMDITIDGLNAGNLAAQSRGLASKAAVQVIHTPDGPKALADAHAHGIMKGFEFHAANKAFSSGYVGSTKTLFFNHVVESLYREFHETKNASKKSDIKAAIGKLARKMNANYSLEEYSFEVSTKDLPQQDAFTRYIGNNDVMLKDITKTAVEGGMVWTKKDIQQLDAEFKGWKSSVNYLRKSLNEKLDSLKKQIASNNGTLEGLDKLTTQRAVENIEELAYNVLDVDVGKPKMIVFGPTVDNTKLYGAWEARIPSIESMVFYGMNNVNGTIQSNMRAEYLLPQKYDQNVLYPGTIPWMKEYTKHKRDPIARDALQTLHRFKNAMLGKAVTKGTVNVNQLNLLIDREGSLEARKDRLSQLQSGTGGMVDLAEEQAKIQRLLRTAMDDGDIFQIESYQEMLDTYTGLLDTKGTKEFLNRSTKSMRFFSHNDVENWQAMVSKNNGIVNLEIPSSANNPLVINIREEVKRMYTGMTGASALSTYDLNKKAQLLIDELQDAQAAAKGKAPFKIDADGNVEVGSIVMAFHQRAENNFNKLGAGNWLANEETSIKLATAKSVWNLEQAYQENNQAKIAVATEQTAKNWIRLHALTGNMAKNSKAYQAMQIDLPGLMPHHQNLENVKTSAESLLDQLSRTDDMTSLGIGKFKKTDVTNMMEKVAKADMNTILITDSMFDSMELPERAHSANSMTEFTGNNVRYAKMLEDSIGKEMTQEIRSGQRYLPGGVFNRYPTTQHSKLLGTKYLVVPDQIGNQIGMNGNSFFAHSYLFSPLQGADSDGDNAVLHYREINNIQHYNDLTQQDREVLRNMISLPDVKNTVADARITYDAEGNIAKIPINQANTIVGWNPNGKALVSHLEYGKNNMLQTRVLTVDQAALDISDFPEAIVQISTGWAQRIPGYFDASDFAKAEAMRGAMPAFSKQLIPQATNLLKKRITQLSLGVEAGKIPGGHKGFSEILGGINHGLVGELGQLPIALGKHHDPTQLAEDVKSFNFWRDPNRFAQYKEQAFERLMSHTDNWAEPPDRSAYRRQFDSAIEFMSNLDTIEKSGDVQGRALTSMYNLMSGRTNANYMDALNLEILDPNNVASKQLSNSVGDLAKTASVRGRLAKFIDGDAATFRKMGKYGAIGAAAALAISFFSPFNPSSSFSPADSFISLGSIANNNENLIISETELPAGTPLDMVNASFSKEAYIRMNSSQNSSKKARSVVMNSVLASTRMNQPYDFYKVPVEPNYEYTNYTTSIPFMGTVDLQRRANL